MGSNNMIIIENRDTLHYLPNTLNVFIILEGLCAAMYVKNEMTVSQRILNFLNNE